MVLGAALAVVSASIAGNTCPFIEGVSQTIQCSAAGQSPKEGKAIDLKAECCSAGASCLGVVCGSFASDATCKMYTAEAGCSVDVAVDGFSVVYRLDFGFTPAPPQSRCVFVKDVKKQCDDEAGDQPGCRVLADNMRHRTCAAFCSENGLKCEGAWEEDSDSCKNPIESWVCDQPYLDSSSVSGVPTSDLICLCAPLLNLPPPTPVPNSEMTAKVNCRWEEHPHTYISCHAGGETKQGGMLEMQQRCEEMGADCAGVVCEELHVRCTVRHNKHCDIDRWLAPSDSETSYVKDCAKKVPISSCSDLKPGTHDVSKVCGECKVLAENMRGQTCKQYCERVGLECVGAWEEDADSCNVCATCPPVRCDERYLDSSAVGGVYTHDLLCECSHPPAAATPAPAALHCGWTERKYAYISCHAAGDSKKGTLRDRQAACEALGPKCAGVTCDGVGVDHGETCTVRHHEACDINQFLAASASETSYVKVCGGCGGLADVVKDCSQEASTVPVAAGACRVLVTNMHMKSCRDYCESQGQRCTAAFDDADGKCPIKEVWDCGRQYDASVADSVMLCECSASTDTPAPKADAPLPSPADRPKCFWKEHSNRYISCHALSPPVEMNLMAAQKKCEDMGEGKCSGVTCSGLHWGCTIRHVGSCDQNEMLAYSESETSYTIKSCPNGVATGTCAGLTSVKKKCTDSPCKFLAKDMRGSTCTAFCQQQGLPCVFAAEEVNDDCQVKELWDCDKPYMSSSKVDGIMTSDMICECAEKVTPTPPPAPWNPRDLKCLWKLMRDTYVSCRVGQQRRTDRDQAMHLCEAEAGSKCGGVTCSAGDGRCAYSVCSEEELVDSSYQPSTMGETTYRPFCDECRTSASPDIVLKCPGAGCKVRATNMVQRSCSRLCEETGLQCLGAHVPIGDKCVKGSNALCDDRTDNVDMVCRCGTEEQRKQEEEQAIRDHEQHIKKDNLPQFQWREYSNAYISCYAAGDKTVGGLLETERQCELMGDDCVGVTCEELYSKCTVRHPGHCDVHKMLEPSEHETSYVKDASKPPPGKGRCEDLPTSSNGSPGVGQRCPSPEGTCVVLAVGVRGWTCQRFCAMASMSCVGAWEEKDDSCTVHAPHVCDLPYLDSSKAAGTMTSDILCQCQPHVADPVPGGGSRGGGGGAGKTVLILLVVGMVGAAGLFVYKSGGVSGAIANLPFLGEARNRSGFRPIQPEALGDDDDGGLFGEDAEEPASQDGDMRLPAPPKQSDRPEL
eukprot:TRINITY_DN772_c0_g4_i1.p1 TRINITY_DN772_c0_g4~~TRINITY_DN772_c0_g4_i1.p1  ORF type:complete len:1244 (+),score=411.70 TRINITY_DN772_c0_g4_i1:122-3853(+)